ncbi:MAG: hypothetical protein ACD_75C01602G0003 [uncultured bacterium]|nr:MAG: hypothetical protein ACD_75C01602G0003 [uncultured bacterium]
MAVCKQQPRPRMIAISGGGILEPHNYLALARKLGADHAIEKPFRPSDLLALVQQLLT